MDTKINIDELQQGCIN